MFRRTAAATAALGVILFIAPSATAVIATENNVEAEPSSTLTWGFKESFRSYISGTIANGDWSVSDGASYETPEFTWTGASGVIDADTVTGEIAFEGAVHFNGHGGILESTIENPVLRFDGPDQAVLLLDITSLSMEDALAGNTDAVLEVTAVPFVSLSLADGEFSVSDDGSAIIGVGIPTAITEEGFEAFGNYPAGTEFDPISFDITLVPAAAPEPSEEPSTEPTPDETDEPGASPTDEPTPTETASDTDSSDGAPNWPLIIFGGVLGTIAGVILVIRNKRASGGEE